MPSGAGLPRAPPDGAPALARDPLPQPRPAGVAASGARSPPTPPSRVRPRRSPHHPRRFRLLLRSHDRRLRQHGECARAFHGTRVVSNPDQRGRLHCRVSSTERSPRSSGSDDAGRSRAPRRGAAGETARLLRPDSVRDRMVGAMAPLTAHRGARTWEPGRARPADVAAGAKRCSNTVLPFVAAAVEHTGCETLCLAGGVFANVTLNRRVLEPRASSGCMSTRPCRTRASGAVLHWPGPAACVPASASRLWDRPRRRRVRRRAGPHGFGGAPAAPRADTAGCWRRERRGAHAGARSTAPAPRQPHTARTDDPAINDWLNARLDRSEYMPFAPVTLASEAEALRASRRRPLCSVHDDRCLCLGRRREHAAVVHVDGQPGLRLDAASSLLPTHRGPSEHQLTDTASPSCTPTRRWTPSGRRPDARPLARCSCSASASPRPQ